MPTLQDFIIPKGVWTELYALTGITSGNQVDIWHKGGASVIFSNSTLAPADTSTGIPLEAHGNITITSSALKIWAYAIQGVAYISVQDTTLQKFRQGAAETTFAHTMGMTYPHALALSLVPGVTRAVALGVNEDVDTGTLPEDIWAVGGLYPWPTAATLLSIVSTNANDTAAGTGARTIFISGLDSLYNAQTETITMNGLTPVISTKQFLRVNTAFILSAGSSKINAGDIDVKNNTIITDILARVVAGKGASRTSNYTVPAGFTLAIDSMFIGINRPSTPSDISIATYFGSPLGFYRLPLEISTAANPYRHDTSPPIIVAEKNDFILRAIYVSANNTSITGAWSGVLYSNTSIAAL